MRQLKSTIIIMIALLCGCSAYMRPVKSAIEDENIENNNVTILRNYNYFGSAMRYWPTLDGQEISGIFPKQHIAIKVPPGKHMVGVNCQWSEDQMEININPNESKFFKISLHPASLIGLACAEIEEISKAEAVERLISSARVKTGHVSDCVGRSVSYNSKPDYTCFSYALP